VNSRAMWLIADVKGWAFDRICRLVQAALEARGVPAEVVYHDKLARCKPQPNDVVVALWWPELYKAQIPAGVHKVAALFDEMSVEKYPKYAAEVWPSCSLAVAGNAKLQAQLATLCGCQIVRADDGVDCELFAPNYKPHDGLVVGFCGRIDMPVKRYEVIKAGVALAQQHEPSISLKVRAFDGRIPHEKMPDWYAGIDMLICASRNEGTPNPVLEACAMGLPVISTPVGLVPEINAHGARIRMLPEDPEPEDIAPAILAYRNAKRRTQDGNRNRKAVEEHHRICYDDLVDALIALPEIEVQPPPPKKKGTIWSRCGQSEPTGPTKTEILRAIDDLRKLVEGWK